jgi:hypothetical protein
VSLEPGERLRFRSFSQERWLPIYAHRLIETVSHATADYPYERYPSSGRNTGRMPPVFSHGR